MPYSSRCSSTASSSLSPEPQTPAPPPPPPPAVFKQQRRPPASRRLSIPKVRPAVGQVSGPPPPSPPLTAGASAGSNDGGSRSPPPLAVAQQSSPARARKPSNKRKEPPALTAVVESAKRGKTTHACEACRRAKDKVRCLQLAASLNLCSRPARPLAQQALNAELTTPPSTLPFTSTLPSCLLPVYKVRRHAASRWDRSRPGRLQALRQARRRLRLPAACQERCVRRGSPVRRADLPPCRSPDHSPSSSLARREGMVPAARCEQESGALHTGNLELTLVPLLRAPRQV